MSHDLRSTLRDVSGGVVVPVGFDGLALGLAQRPRRLDQLEQFIEEEQPGLVRDASLMPDVPDNR